MTANLVIVSPHLPYDGVPHAGAEYVARHIAALGSNFSVTFIAPNTPENRQGAQKSNTILIDGSGTRSRAYRWIAKVLNAVRGLRIGGGFERGVSASTDAANTLRSASIIEFQWTLSASVLPLVKELAPHAPTVLICHDVYSQLWERNRVAERRLLKRIYARFRGTVALRAERKVFRSVDHIVVFSDKDAELVRGIYSAAQVSVYPPPLSISALPRRDAKITARDEKVLFTGALDMAKNEEAVNWMLDSIWPTITREFPRAEFWVVGANPSESIRARAASLPRVSVTGYVPSLDEYYAHASVFVAPLLRGSGVKFKVIAAMLHGLPIVATSVAAEGIGDNDLYWGVCDDAETFSEAVITALANMNDAISRAARAQEWAEEAFGSSAFDRRITRLYLELSATGSM